MRTSLDPNSVIELLKYCEEEPDESKYSKDSFSEKNDDSISPEFCREHPDEILKYFCFTCETECICAECVIHGEHKAHEVLQIKKAYPQIKDKLEEIFLHLTSKIDEVELRGEKMENYRKEIVEQGNAAKQQVLVSFEDLRGRIERKEKEIIGNIERIVKENLKEAENFNRIINGKIRTLEMMSENFKRVLTVASEPELLDFYSENKEKIYTNIGNELASLTNIDRTTHLRCVISTNSLAEHIESIKSVQIQISVLKGFEEIPNRKVPEKNKRFNSKNG